MRRSLAIIVILFVAITPVFVLYPWPEVIPREDQPAQHVSTWEWRHDAPWFGGLSGLELTLDGQMFYAASDRGQIIQGQITRENGVITDVAITANRDITDQLGQTSIFPFNDAEGLALDAQDRLYVSFEHAQRILYYPKGSVEALWPSYSHAWRVLPKNAGLELVAIDDQGTLYTIPEGIERRVEESLVYRRRAGGAWEQPFNYLLKDGFAPVGGDFGPDGRLYILERGIYLASFQTRVRSMRVTPTGFTDVRTELETGPWDYGNVEGLAVWQEIDGDIRLTMVSDDNFLWLLPSQIVEYRIPRDLR